MTKSIIPIYTSRGEAEALLAYPYIFNRTGDWIGFVTAEKNVYSILGHFVGKLTMDPRIVRKRFDDNKPSIVPPVDPGQMYFSNTIPLPGLMADLPYGLIDVLLDEPFRLHTSDTGELKEDLY
ncbi:MAG: 4-fold beta flower protein [Chloroflexota bacterium]